MADLEEYKDLLEPLEDEIEEISDIEQIDVDFENVESLRVEKKPKIYTNDKPYNFSEDQERADVFIKNYLMKFDMAKSLKIFEQEFFELLSKGDIEIERIQNVPNIYIENEILQEKIGNIQKELDDAKIYAEKAKSLFLKLHRAKENEKIRHRRVQQEKKKLTKEIDKLRRVYDEDTKIYKDLKQRYHSVTIESVVLEQDLLTAKQKVENLNEQLEKYKVNLEEVKKQNDHIVEISEKLEKKNEEKKGNKLIKWTPWPVLPKNLIDFNAIQTASVRMNPFKNFPGHLAAVTSIDFHPKKAIIATTSDDKTWKLWKYPTGELLMHGEGHKDWVSGVSFHPDGVLLATCGGDATIKLWNIIEEKCVHTIIDHAQPVWKNKFHSSGQFLLSACMDHTIRLYDMNNYKSRMSYRAHVDSVNSINFMYLSNNFVSASADKTLSMWDMRSNICVQTYYGHNNAVNCAVANNRGDIIASCDSDGVVKLWDIRMVREIANVDECKQSANTVAFDKSGVILAVGFDDSNIRIINSKSGKVDTVYKGHEEAVLDVMYDPNNMALLSCSADKTFRIWQQN